MPRYVPERRVPDAFPEVKRWAIREFERISRIFDYGSIYDIAGMVVGKPDAGITILRYKFPRAVSFPAGLYLSQGVAAVAATGISNFTIQKNGGSIGTMSWAALGTIPTFTFASAVTFVLGDILTVVAPSPADATLADFGYVFAGRRLD